MDLLWIKMNAKLLAQLNVTVGGMILKCLANRQTGKSTIAKHIGLQSVVVNAPTKATSRKAFPVSNVFRDGFMS